MAGNLIDYDAARAQLLDLMSQLDALAERLAQAVHHHERQEDKENVVTASDEVGQAWALLGAALDDLADVQPAARRVTTVLVGGGVL